ncbi:MULTISPECIES: hypothetical protein [unclassified Bradyrhizobium]|uniref:AbiU2 domain-containing protein n=1 Tax=unclassified Bradyrhizobium TaxID=2631580 RepID=UPI002916C2B9|nr:MULTISPECIES: hypothetical protein [unclassified Bradyrhizobium]
MSKRSNAEKAIERLTRPERIRIAKAKIKKVLDHFLYLIELHANNSFVVFSPVLASQIPRSLAANAFDVFQRSMYRIEVVRLCAIWDSIDVDKENIPTVVELIDDDGIIEMLAGEARIPYLNGAGGGLINPSEYDSRRGFEQEMTKKINLQFADEHASTARAELRQAIADTRSVLGSERLSSIMNLRDKHLAHSLETTRREKEGPVQPMKYGDETKLLDASIPIVERLYCWVYGSGFSIKKAQKIDQDYADALWASCKFVDPR